ncbi:hypothetical protein BDN72DRAFT_271484 [Pluteus cervinus]|uniref:Uncharacterized protein n=1 Tax=Pluteus cervinus TaxID=181527 RepID=A0ACD3B566_9AGAR|nr:hypothetical protein BDN72DRAFT_271484 [Pluteus cervinus]
MCLLNPRGWDDFVRHSCGLFSSKFIQAGMDLGRSRRFIFIRARVSGEAQPQYIVLYVRQAISQQLCLRGRATLVEKLGVLSSANSENEARSQASELLQHRPPPDIIQLPDLHENYIMSHAKFLELAPADDDINVPVIDSTKELICRDLWVVKGSTSVQDYKHSMRNKFGVNSVIGFTRVEDTCKFSDDSLSLEPSNILPSPGGPQIRDIRIHVRSFSEVQGVRRLADAKTPRQFVTAVVHAMLGHFNLWNSQGILHCGINPDSILITDATPRDSISEITAASKLTACQGVLLGEDTGRSVHESLSIEGEIDTDGLDLLYYLPIRVLWAKLHNRPGNRDIWDDLESALWVMIFEYLKIVARVNPKFEYKPLLHYDEMFSTTDGSSILRAKHVIIVEWLLRDTAPGFGPFREFFTLWYKLLDDGSSDTLQSLRDFFERILSYVAREKGDWDSWEAFWEAGGGYEEAYFLQKLEAFNRWVGD